MKQITGLSRLVTLAVQLTGVASLAALAIVSVAWWAELPDRIETGVAGGLGGAPPSSFWTWFGLPALGAAATVFFFAMQAMRGVMERRPWLISLPRQKAFAALPPAERTAVIRFALGRLLVFPVPVNAFMIYGQWAQLQAAHGRLQRIDLMAVAGFLLAALFAVAWYLVSISTFIKRLEGNPEDNKKRHQ